MITISDHFNCLTIGLISARLHLSVEFIGVVLAKLRCSLFSPCIPLAYGWGFVVKQYLPVEVL
jgi:hypothetical protein